MLKKTILTLLIPLPLMAMALAAAMFLEFQKLPAAATQQVTPMEFVRLKVDQLLQSREARAAVSKQSPSQPKHPKQALEVAKADIVLSKPDAARTLAAEQVAKLGQAQAALQAELAKQLEEVGSLESGEADVSLGARISGLFSSGKAAEEEKPQRMVCKMHRGFKRCRFPEEK